MTVAELIKELQAFPSDTEVVLCDADTGWSMPIHVGGDSAEYGNMQHDRLYIWGTYDEALSA